MVRLFSPPYWLIISTDSQLLNLSGFDCSSLNDCGTDYREKSQENGISSNKQLNSLKKVFSSICTSTSRAEFGKKCKDQHEFILVTEGLVMKMEGFAIGDFSPSATWLQLLTDLRPKLDRLHQQTDQI
ncbi:hypothetical protein RIF29_15092 [Crotalaria pallida]|uniref:Uncharacterized protein n=1 Tax=Crotalaria pallida TaxID=3830 RepID=A0AAN9FCW3_CROPI